MDTTTISNRELLIKNITEIATAKPTETPTNHVQTVREQTVIILPLPTTTTTTTLPTTTTSLPTTTPTVPTTTTTTTTAIPTTVRTTTIQTTIPTTTTTTSIPIVDTTTTLKTTQFEIPEDPVTSKSTTNAFDRNVGLWQELLRFQPAVMHSTTEVLPIFTRETLTSTTTIPTTAVPLTTSKPVQRFEDINVLVSLKYFFLVQLF